MDEDSAKIVKLLALKAAVFILLPAILSIIAVFVLL